ncbi:MAG TPA: cytochrome c [Balneolales bacterium]|nr:cytochrome c [Balneolales bacterium]
MTKEAIAVYLIVFLFIWGCSSDSKKTKEQPSEVKSEQSVNGLTPFQIENGIGPITEPVELGPVDDKLAAKGKEIFENNCSSCHQIGKRYVGPDLQEVTSRRTAAYIMNMIMNPVEMTQKNPTAHKLLEQFATQMANLQLKKDQARAVVEYLHSVNPNSKQK